MDSSDYTTSAAIPVVRFTEHDFRLHPAYERPAVLALSREEVHQSDAVYTHACPDASPFLRLSLEPILAMQSRWVLLIDLLSG